MLKSSHRYERDCCCPTCAEWRANSKLGAISDFINWANAGLLAGARRFVESHVKPLGVDVPVTLLRENGLALKHVPTSTKFLRLTDQLGHARA